MKMRLKDGKSKVLTLSYDDGVVQDIRLIEILDKYGIKATFNLNSSMYLAEDKDRERFYGRLKLSEAKALYTDSCHEVALHTYTHPFLDKMDTTEIVYEITEDRRALERDYGRIVRGMAYPYGTYNQRVLDVLKMCGVAYARTVNNTSFFNFPSNWLTLNPTCHHNSPKLSELIKTFVETKDRYNNPWMFYLWGHSYEFDNNDNWDVIERFAEYAGGREDVWYATNIEIYNYVKAYESLETSFDKRIIHNPSHIDVWADVKGEAVKIKRGETVYL